MAQQGDAKTFTGTGSQEIVTVPSDEHWKITYAYANSSYSNFTIDSNEFAIPGNNPNVELTLEPGTTIGINANDSSERWIVTAVVIKKE